MSVIAEQFKELHARGLTNRAIAREMGVHHKTVSDSLKRLGLEPNGTTRKSIEMVDDEHAKCSKCKEIKPVGEFLMNRVNAKYPYRLSYCNSCRRAQVNKSLVRIPQAFLADRFNRLKLRCSKSGTPINIEKQDLFEIYERQQGKCFYTDTPMELQSGGGLKRNSLSIDKIIPEKGYVKGNVVLCTYRANTMKGDLTMEEIKAWLPGWHERIMCLQCAEGNF